MCAPLLRKTTLNEVVEEWRDDPYPQRRARARRPCGCSKISEANARAGVRTRDRKGPWLTSCLASARAHSSTHTTVEKRLNLWRSFFFPPPVVAPFTKKRKHLYGIKGGRAGGKEEAESKEAQNVTSSYLVSLHMRLALPAGVWHGQVHRWQLD